jgi:hypothetical protein
MDRPLLFYVLVPVRMSDDNPELMPTQRHWCSQCVLAAVDIGDHEGFRGEPALERILDSLHSLHRKVDPLMSALQDAIDAIKKAAADNAAAQAAMATAIADNTQAVGDLVAEIKAGGAPSAQQVQDLVDAAAALETNAQTATTTATALDAAAKAVDPGPQPGPITLDGPLTATLSLATAPSTTRDATEAGFTGTLSAAAANPAVASVSPASGAGPGPVAFTITAVALGATTVDFTDGQGNKTSVDVTVIA